MVDDYHREIPDFFPAFNGTSTIRSGQALLAFSSGRSVRAEHLDSRLTPASVCPERLTPSCAIDSAAGQPTLGPPGYAHDCCALPRLWRIWLPVWQLCATSYDPHAVRRVVIGGPVAPPSSPFTVCQALVAHPYGLALGVRGNGLLSSNGGPLERIRLSGCGCFHNGSFFNSDSLWKAPHSLYCHFRSYTGSRPVSAFLLVSGSSFLQGDGRNRRLVGPVVLVPEDRRWCPWPL